MNSLNKIKAILFDLDGTLRHHLPTGGEVFVKYARSLGLQISERDKIHALHWEHFYFASSPEIRVDTETFKDDRAGFWVNFARRHLIALGTDTTQAIELAPQVSAYMAESYKPEVHVPPDAYELLAHLKEADYILGVISNRDEQYHEELVKLNLDSFFKFSLAGGEVNSYKPDSLIFERGLELAGVSASETVYIGDNYFADILGSLHAGLTPVLYDPRIVFPEAECAIIRSFSELPGLLN